jgi:hypothetical protein
VDFWATIKVLGRRWYVALPLFLIAVGMTGMLYKSVPTRYVSRSVIVLAEPATGPTTTVPAGESVARTNPLLNFRYGLSEAATILVQIISTPQVTGELTAGTDAELVVTNGSANLETFVSSPFFVVETTDESIDTATAVTMRAIERAQVELEAVQSRLGAAPGTFVTFVEVVPPTAELAPTTDAKRSVGAAFAVAMIVTLGGTFAAESFATARRARGAAEDDKAAESDGAAAPDLAEETAPTDSSLIPAETFVPVGAVSSNGEAKHGG